MIEIHYIVSGHVQGVSFRKYAKKKAISLNINGYAKNLSDMTVKVVAQHNNQELLNEFYDWLKIGSAFSNVECVNINIQNKIEKKFDDFQRL